MWWLQIAVLVLAVFFLVRVVWTVRHRYPARPRGTTSPDS